MKEILAEFRKMEIPEELDLQTKMQLNFNLLTLLDLIQEHCNLEEILTPEQYRSVQTILKLYHAFNKQK